MAFKQNDQETWGKFVETAAKLDIEPSDLRKERISDNNIYLKGPDGNIAFSYDAMLVGFLFGIIDLKDEVKKLRDILEKQSEWLASKELQDVLRSKVEALEERLEKVKKK